MKPQLVRLSAIVIGILCAAAAHAEDISAKKLKIKDNAEAAKKQIQVQSADAGVQKSEADNPATNRAAIHVYSATDDQCIILSAGTDFWTDTGSAWKYKHKDTKTAVQISDGKLKAKIKSNVTYTLADDGTQGAVNVLVQFGGGTSYCMRCSANGGHAYLVSGKDGAELRAFAPNSTEPTFGWYVARLDDLDGDRKPDLAVGAQLERDANAALVGGAYVFSSASGKQLHHWQGSTSFDDFGEIVAATSDLDGDGVDDIAIGAPWYRAETGQRTGRVEFRSGRSREVLAELVGDQADGWFGWHIRRAPDPAGRGRAALLIGSLRHSVGEKAGVGVIDWYVLRRA